MFWSLKNRIKEETGNDVDMIPSIVNSNHPKLLNKDKKSCHGSSTSLGSFTIDGNKEDVTVGNTLDMTLADGKIITPKEFKKLETKEDEWRRKLQKKEEESIAKLKKTEEIWKKQLEEKEKEMKEELQKKNMENKNLKEEKNELMLKIMNLEESIKKAEDYQKKVCQYQEDIDQLEGFQTQEMAKIKHLLLVKEQDLAEREKLIKDNESLIKSLKSEITRLRNFEQLYENAQDDLEALRHNFDVEKAQLSSKLAEKEEDVRHLRDRVTLLEERVNSWPPGDVPVDERVRKLLGERALFERRLEEAHLHLSQIKSSWSSKIESLETQVGRLCRQASEESSEKRQAELERDLLKAKLAELEEDLEKAKAKCDTKDGKIDKLTVEKIGLEEEIKNLKIRRETDVENLREEIASVNKNNLDLEEKLECKMQEGKEKDSLIKNLESALEEERKKKALVEQELSRRSEELEAERSLLVELTSMSERDKREKDEMMMRNAEVSQQAELTRQELRNQAAESLEWQSKATALEEQLREKQKDLDRAHGDNRVLDKRVKELERLRTEQESAYDQEKNFKVKIQELENELFEKNKSVKILQQRLSDIKKTLQRELKVPMTGVDPGGTYTEGLAASWPSSSSPASGATGARVSTGRRLEDGCDEATDDVNFKYLKHVLIKFLTSRECEAQHLTRAVATLLRFSAEEERLLKETLEWKMSWFGTRPNLGNGQTAKTIPPS